MRAATLLFFSLLASLGWAAPTPREVLEKADRARGKVPGLLGGLSSITGGAERRRPHPLFLEP